MSLTVEFILITVFNIAFLLLFITLELLVNAEYVYKFEFICEQSIVWIEINKLLYEWMNKLFEYGKGKNYKFLNILFNWFIFYVESFNLCKKLRKIHTPWTYLSPISQFCFIFMI